MGNHHTGNHHTKQYMSLLSGNELILDGMQNGDHILLLYDYNVALANVFRSFIKQGISNDEHCLYVFPTECTKFHPDYVFKESIKNGCLSLFPLPRYGEPEKMQDMLAQLCDHIKSDKAISRVLADFGGILDSCGVSALLNYQKQIFEHEACPHTLLSAFDMMSMDAEALKSLVKLHEKVLVTTQNESVISLPVFYDTKKHTGMSIDTVPHETMDHIVKSNLETIVLSILYHKPMCGYDLIKALIQHYHVFLSQGTVYPLLYSLKEYKILKVETCHRSKIYSLTRQGKQIVKGKLDDFANAYEYLLQSVNIGD